MPATQSNWMAWPRAVVFPPPLRRLEIIETAATWKRMRIETMILNILMFSPTAEASSITGRARSEPKRERAETSVSTKPSATPAIESPNFRTIAMVTLRLVTVAISNPRATPRIVLADRARRRRKESRLPTERETISAVAAG